MINYATIVHTRTHLCMVSCECFQKKTSSLCSFIAEELQRHGFARKTFRINTDWRGRARCSVFRSRLSRSDALALRDVQLWRYLLREIESPNGRTQLPPAGVETKTVALLPIIVEQAATAASSSTISNGGGGDNTQRRVSVWTMVRGTIR